MKTNLAQIRFPSAMEIYVQLEAGELSQPLQKNPCRYFVSNEKGKASPADLAKQFYVN